MEEIARDPDCVLYRALVAQTVAACGSGHERSRDRDKAKFGFNVQGARVSRDTTAADQITEGAMAVYFGKRGHGIALLKPKY
jgi:hypothetical protein